VLHVAREEEEAVERRVDLGGCRLGARGGGRSGLANQGFHCRELHVTREEEEAVERRVNLGGSRPGTRGGGRRGLANQGFQCQALHVAREEEEAVRCRAVNLLRALCKVRCGNGVMKEK
jgi:hypothetical protein